MPAPSYTIRVGNPSLKAEKAHQYEIGLVFQPSELPGLNISVDYYHIKLTGAIGTLSARPMSCSSASPHASRVPTQGRRRYCSGLSHAIARTPCTPCPRYGGRGSRHALFHRPGNHPVQHRLVFGDGRGLRRRLSQAAGCTGHFMERDDGLAPRSHQHHSQHHQHRRTGSVGDPGCNRNRQRTALGPVRDLDLRS